MIKEGHRDNSGNVKWLCLCECGNSKEVSSRALRKGMTISCGCSNRHNLLGKRFGYLTVVERYGNDSYGNIVWKCECDCGNIQLNTSNNLVQGKTLSCGCRFLTEMRKEMIGKKFERLTVIEEIGRNNSRAIIWRCKCDCGAETKATTSQLKSGAIKSCGCYQRDILSGKSTSHGMSRTRIYRIWQDAKTRCNNPNTPYYFKYGGRGIKLTEQWNDFEPFMKWALANGYQDNLTLDRIDVNGNYEPDNCRWITNREQQFNKRTNHYLAFDGKTQTITQWAEELNMNPKTLQARIMDYHWLTEKALTTPVKARIRREKK